MPETDHMILVIAVLILSGLMIIGLGILCWLNVSRSRLARKFQGPPPSEPFPHMHLIDGVVVTHAHIEGDREHEHGEITISMKHYAELAKRAQDSSPAS